jgi:hypothetical protein
LVTNRSNNDGTGSNQPIIEERKVKMEEQYGKIMVGKAKNQQSTTPPRYYAIRTFLG